MGHGDSVVPSADDGSSEVIIVDTDIVMFGSRYRSLHVSQVQNLPVLLLNT